MKISVCELPNSRRGLDEQWPLLVRHAHESGSDLVLLPELPFFPWLAWRRRFNRERWSAAVSAHEDWLDRIPELFPAAVCGTRPLNRYGRRLNMGFVSSGKGGYAEVHSKYYLPQEKGFWERSWYERGDAEFRIHRISELALGFLICTELWFFQRARSYGKQGVHVICCPRATPQESLSKWLAGGRAAAVVAGAFCISSNRISQPRERADLGGRGWIIDPEGKVLGVTSPEEPFLTLDVDIGLAEIAKRTYPRYVPD